MSATIHPNHADDTGILDSLPQSPAPDWFECQHDLTTITTGLFAHPHRLEITLMEIHTEARNRLCGPKTIGGLEIEVTEQWMRQMRALIDRALGDRT
jgi:hypothetical protein